MSRRSKGVRLWLEPAEHKREGGLVRHASWVIRDGKKKVRIGCPPEDRQRAEEALARYIEKKYRPDREKGKSSSEVLVLDVLNVYLADCAPNHARPDETRQRVLKLAEFWEPYSLDQVKGQSCRAYASWRKGRSSVRGTGEGGGRQVVRPAARRELEDLRAAINYYRREGYTSGNISVWLPERSAPREIWLTRSEAALLLWSAWRGRQRYKGGETQRAIGKHIARFILVGLYTGSRHAAICGASFVPAIGRGYVDLESGIFYRRAQGAEVTKKRQPPVRLPDRLLAHMRRWHRKGLSRAAVVEWNGKPIRSVKKGFRSVVLRAGLAYRGVTPHTLRHTSATWMMRAGVSLWDAAGFLGMSAEVLERVYGHHHPDFQRVAGAALAGQDRDRYAQNKSR